MADVKVAHQVPGTGNPESLLDRFGLQSFRPGQRDVIDAVADGRDCLCIMPTGGGKSLCYQLPALSREGTTIVVSPLIALMKDQVDALQARGIDARLLNSSLTMAEHDATIEAMASGQVKLVYIAPERLRNGRFLEAIRRVKVSLLAIDEAHCVSEWGHDFRPDYARLGAFRQRYLNNVQTIALTATATPTVRDDICGLLNLDQPSVFVTGFARTNLRFSVDHFQSDSSKDERLAQHVAQTDGTGIIYAATRKRCEAIGDWLPERSGKRVGVYHAGLDPTQRHQVQEAFMSGKLAAIVATNAFGMGIDKSDIRYVIHYNMPGSLEAYYQEAGRAGRDGKMSGCRLLFSYQDRYIQEFFIENRYPSRETVQKVYQYLCSLDDDPIELTLDQVRQAIDVKDSAEAIGTAETLLAKAGVLRRLDSSSNHAVVRIDDETPTLLDYLPREAKLRRKVMTAIEKVVGRRRGEDVYVRPSRLAELAGVDREQLSRTLRELQKLRSFDYVPPFRGRAIHFTRRDVRFDDLAIDFDELQRRKDAEYQKLDAVIDFARTSGCRQRVVLRYFGDPNATDCGLCDRCDPTGQRSGADVGVVSASKMSATPSSGVSKIDPVLLQRGVQVVLSGVTRTHGRFGKTLVAQMLCGSKSKKLQQWKLNRLSTYGLLDKLRQTEVVQVMDELIAAGLLKQVEVDQRRPTVHLTDDGRDVMHAKASVPDSFQPAYPLARKLAAAVRSLEKADVTAAAKTEPDAPRSSSEPPNQPEASNAASTPQASETTLRIDNNPGRAPESPAGTPASGKHSAEADLVASSVAVSPQEQLRSDLEERLKRFRRKRAAAMAVPAHQIVSAATLQRIARRQPQTTTQLESVEGMSTELIESAGHDLVQIVLDCLADAPQAGDLAVGGQGDDSSEPSGTATAYYWTWKLRRDGYTCSQIQEIRGLSADAVRGHLIRADGEGYPVDPQWLSGQPSGD
ncbi:ATP-dependent DNA helicase RecQ [Crateriforma conspicua]|uniref:ATP-dependent DNA helicase RecQ n=1 Tax=Crateriforma conspicua TaxID=2527996 RepID=A0A5C6FTH8_9PLAN|nr:ATP-dependent DNA helicase RecQ [Crateriforma conspicua]TWU64808.1 ATP-dependent DNA helicase RecQ [Crateriforma conspicua]